MNRRQQTNHENTREGSSFVVSGSYTIFAAVLSNKKKVCQHELHIPIQKVGKLAVSQLPNEQIIRSLFEFVIHNEVFNSPYPCRPLGLSSPSTQTKEPTHSPAYRKYLLLKTCFEQARADATNQLQ